MSNLQNTKNTPNYTDIYVPALIPDMLQTMIIKLDQKYNRRPDLLAYDLYGNAKLWWVFALYNRNEIVDPIHDFVAGAELVVPTEQFALGLQWIFLKMN